MENQWIDLLNLDIWILQGINKWGNKKSESADEKEGGEVGKAEYTSAQNDEQRMENKYLDERKSWEWREKLKRQNKYNSAEFES